MTITTTARREGPGLRHAVDIDGRHTLHTDEPESVGGADTAPTPHELLPASLAACIATTVEMYAARKGWDVRGLAVEVEYDKDARPRRFGVAVHLPAALTPEQHERLMVIAGRCPVHRALSDGFAFDERLVVASAEPAAVA